MTYRLLCVWLTVVVGLPLCAQELGRPLEIEDFNRWQTVAQGRLSADGRWSSQVHQPGDGDPTLMLYDHHRGQRYSFARAHNARFDADSRFLVFIIQPPQDSLRAQRRRKVKADQLPGDTLAILDLSIPGATPVLVPNVLHYQLPEKWGGWLAYGLKTPLPDSLAKKLDKDSYRLVIRPLNGGDTLVVDGGKAYTYADEAPAFLLHSSGRDSVQLPGLYYFDPRVGRLDTLLSGQNDYPLLALHRLGQHAALVAAPDSTDAHPVRPWTLYGWQVGQPRAQALAGPGDAWLPNAEWGISPNAELTYAHAGNRLYFGATSPPALPDTSLLEEEIVRVEVWATSSPVLYTQQEAQLKRERERAYTAVYHLDERRALLLHDSTAATLLLANRGDAPFALAVDEQPYLHRVQWEGSPTAKDLYVVNVATAQRIPIARALRAEPHWSPGGAYVYWYSVVDTAWVAYSLADGQTRQLTSNHTVAFYDEDNDVPDYPEAYGVAGWEAGDRALYLYDRYDWWRADPRGQTAPTRLTQGRSRQQRLRFVRLDPEQRFFDMSQRVLVHTFTETNYHQGYAWLSLASGQLTPLQDGPYAYDQQPIKARGAEAYLYTRENFEEFPDLRYSTDLRDGQVMAPANPWQAEYRWGSIEHISWTSLDGQLLKGLLVKPAGFDPSQQYPLIVNFYERNSETIHSHRPPYAHRSQINYAYYVSRGYVIFNPDIPYREGYPGESAYNAVIPGVTALLDAGFIDRQRVGIQGHSWGGYQIAYLLTKTDLFRCAEAGAPVVNMVSGYGGIRWQSGLSRQFQYERTQSRLGGSLWERPLRYLENSPIFWTDKINTPVLIMHNDADGAVPWYQGIEWFTALRRLGKPAWLLNYQGEPHWPVKPQNRMDFQRRMSQFFDYFLRDAPQPGWMKEGVPAVRRGF